MVLFRLFEKGPVADHLEAALTFLELGSLVATARPHPASDSGGRAGEPA